MSAIGFTLAVFLGSFFGLLAGRLFRRGKK